MEACHFRSLRLITQHTNSDLPPSSKSPFRGRQVRWLTSRGLLSGPRSICISRMAASSFASADSSNSEGFGRVPSDFTEVIVVRHGETTWNACGKIQGHLDIELNDIGRHQAAAVGDRLSKEYSVSAIYSSDLKRAYETAQIIAKSCALPEVKKDARLRERHLGDLQGVVFREASKLKTKAYQAFVSPKTDQEVPGGGESLDQLYDRATSGLEEIAAKHKGEQIVVVTHGGALRALCKRAGRSAPRGSPQGKVLNTSISIFHLSNSHWIIKRWGDVGHLDRTGFLESGFGGDRHSG
ncbi:phosphoglycerate mutase-like protein 4 isoform X2 [Aristolochia californica]|uniref:phosphoglycerate mutase-like protein 4 isoform X2 n=1 Tax=Aristolochia californica TaxID=171875 RepID=UPI0035D81E0A